MKYVFLFLFLFPFYPSFSQIADSTVTKDFGEVQTGDTLRHCFDFEASVKSVKNTCSCTTSSQQKGKVCLSISTTGRSGILNKKSLVTLTNGKTIQISFTATILIKNKKYKKAKSKKSTTKAKYRKRSYKIKNNYQKQQKKQGAKVRCPVAFKDKYRWYNWQIHR